MSKRKINVENLDAEQFQVYSLLQRTLESYDANYKFIKDNIYYDAKVNPIKHAKAFYESAALCEELGFPTVQIFPLRNSKVPRDVFIDTFILRSQILNTARPPPGGDIN
jgi:hypothetical protein